jgi:hypothetical protein
MGWEKAEEEKRGSGKEEEEGRRVTHPPATKKAYFLPEPRERIFSFLNFGVTLEK